MTKGTPVSRSPGERVTVGRAELATVSKWVTHDSVVSGLCGKSVRVGKVVLISASELVTSEVTTPDTPGEPVIVGMTELVCAPERVTHEAVVAGSLGERVRDGITILDSVSELVACEVTMSGTPGEMGIFGIAELASVSILVAIEGVLSESSWETLGVIMRMVGLDSAGWFTKETFVFDSCRDSVRFEKVVLVPVPELVMGEVTIASPPSETVIVGMPELDPAPRLVAVEDVISNALWEKLGVFLETKVLVSVEWTQEVVVSGS